MLFFLLTASTASLASAAGDPDFDQRVREAEATVSESVLSGKPAAAAQAKPAAATRDEVGCIVESDRDVEVELLWPKDITLEAAGIAVKKDEPKEIEFRVALAAAPHSLPGQQRRVIRVRGSSNKLLGDFLVEQSADAGLLTLGKAGREPGKDFESSGRSMDLRAGPKILSVSHDDRRLFSHLKYSIWCKHPPGRDIRSIMID